MSDTGWVKAEFDFGEEARRGINDVTPEQWDAAARTPLCPTPSLAETSLGKQEGGSHYKNLTIQPIEYIQANKLGYEQGNVVKYVTRYKEKGGVGDLLKAIHYLELMIDDIKERR